MRVGVLCRVTDHNLYDITYKNHKLYCHRNNIKYSLLDPKLSIISFIQNIDYVLYLNEHYRFLQFDNDMSTLIHNKSHLLYSKIDSTIDKNLIMISTNPIGQRIMQKLLYNSIQEVLSAYDLENCKNTEQLPHLFKLPIQKYTQYVGIRSKVFMIDTNDIENQTALLLHKTLNNELGIK